MLTELLRSRAILHVSSAIPLLALPCRSELRLRSALVAAVALNLAHVLSLSPFPNWQDLLWPAVSTLINCAVLARLILDRFPTGLTVDEREAHAAMRRLTPGQFKALVAPASWRKAETATVLTRQGAVPGCLYYVLSGGVVVDKGERSFVVEPRTFVGEVAYLQRTPASATVTAQPGTTYLEWPVEALDRRLRWRRSLGQAVLEILTDDMAAKVART